MRIPENTIQQILNSVNITDVVGQYVQLRAKGKNHWGLCPFHGEKTPSFSVNDSKQIYYCFGCHNGGNAFRFLMEYKKISYIEAVKELAAQLGITLQYEDGPDEKEVTELELMHDLNDEIQKIFAAELTDAPSGKSALDYLTNRGMKLTSIRSFGLGLAPSGRDYLQEHYKSNLQKLERAVKLGLIGENESGKKYDRFAGRIIFPIYTASGRVAAFAGRVMGKSEGGAKYVNSPESPIYTKGKILYGLSLTKDEIRKAGFAIVVEGYMDLISLYQAGVKNVIAVSGTALTDDQTHLLSRYTKDVVLLFDSDEAGVKASMRSVEILLRKNMNIKIASLPNGEDPDSFITNNSVAGFMLYINNAVDFLEFQTAFYDKSGMLQDPMKSAQTIRALLHPLTFLDDKLKQAFLLKNLSAKFSLRLSLLEDELEKMSRGRVKEEKRVAERIVKSDTAGKQSAQAPEKFSPQLVRIEQSIIKLAVEGEYEVLIYLRKNVLPQELHIEAHQQILKTVYDLSEQEDELTTAMITDKFTDEKIVNYIVGLLADKYTVSDTWEEQTPLLPRDVRMKRAVVDVVRSLKLYEVQAETARLKSALKEALSEEEKIDITHQLNEQKQRKKEVEALYRLAGSTF